MATEYAKCDDTGLHSILYAIFDKRGKEGQVHSYGEGGRAVEVGYFGSQKCTSRCVAGACDIVCELGHAMFFVDHCITIEIISWNALELQRLRSDAFRISGNWR